VPPRSFKDAPEQGERGGYDKEAQDESLEVCARDTYPSLMAWCIVCAKKLLLAACLLTHDGIYACSPETFRLTLRNEEE
jgi:hypothetical protein